MPGGLRTLAWLAALLLIGGCARLVPEAHGPLTTMPPSAAGTAIALGVAPGPKLSSLDLTPGDAGPALVSFIDSCPALLARTDSSGLTRASDWREACTAATQWEYRKAAKFFEIWFETVKIGGGEAFATGYYEPEIAGSRIRRRGFEVPVYGLPADLLRAWPEGTPDSARTGRPPLGRRAGDGSIVPYFDRAEIEDGALAGKGLEIAWAADPADFYFLQIQGSGRLRTPEGEAIELGYAGTNGRDYRSIGALMRERGLIGEGPGRYPGSMQGIVRYLRDHPQEGRALMRENRSYIFFRERQGDGPVGALGVPLRREASLAADPQFAPLGAPVFLALDHARAGGLWVAQDTGGAIKGANRFDTFWGAGDEAREIAGGMQARGQAYILLPKGTLARLGVQ